MRRLRTGKDARDEWWRWHLIRLLAGLGGLSLLIAAILQAVETVEFRPITNALCRRTSGIPRISVEDEMSAVTVINSFEVPAGRESEFLELWKKVNAHMQRKPGYLGNKLHRAIAPDAPFQFVHVAQWTSMAHFQRAHDTGFRELVDQPAWCAFLPHRVLLEVVHEGQADSGSSE